jgi:hypothetical protein
MKTKLHRIIAKNNPWNYEDQIELSIIFKNEDKLFCLSDSAIEGDTFEIKELNNTVYPNFRPSIFITLEKAQELCDSLYAIGIRPNQAKGSIGQLAAVQYHLEDMRKLVFREQK